MGIKRFEKKDFVYLNYLKGDKTDLFPISDPIGKLPRIKMKLPKISFLLPDVKLLV